MIIKRYFSDENLKRIQDDFDFLINIIKTTFGEFDFAIRDNYFNIYYKGNSISKVEPKKNSNLYKVSINPKFFDNTNADNCIYYKSKKTSNNILLESKQLHRFFQKKHLLEFASRIKKVHYGEEIDFEQSLITDNLNRTDFIFVDRQVTDNKLNRKRLDLLAIRQNINEKDNYNFVVCEVKLGNNAELKNKVASQLSTYVDHINLYFNEYKNCYEKQLKQKQEFGLLPTINKINIIKPVEGIILVGGYSQIAKQQIDELQTTYPKLKVKQFINEI